MIEARKIVKYCLEKNIKSSILKDKYVLNMTLKFYKTILLITILTNFKILASSELKVSKFSDIPNKINVNCQNTLVIFDIDGVILFPKDGYLKPLNRKSRRIFLDKIEKEKGENEKKRIFGLIVSQMDYEVSDKSFYEFFYKLKLNSCKLLALTSMGPNNPYIDQESDRVNILRDKGIIFEQINFQFNIDKQDRPQPFMKNGVIFARGYEKGVVLKHLLENFNFNESVNLIFIDDMKRNIDSVRNHISSKVDTVYLILYEFIEPHYELDGQITEIQKEYLLNYNVWLSDKQVKIYLNSRKQHD